MSRDRHCLIALDLDGTSVRYDPRLEMDPTLIQYLSSVRGLGIRWLMNSDRFTDTMREIANRLMPEDKPTALLSCQRFIHFLNGDNNYVPFTQWNEQQLSFHKELWDDIVPFFDAWSETIEKEFTVLSRVINDIVFAFMVPHEQNSRLRGFMEECVKPWTNAQVSGNQEWTFILHSSFSKAAVLKKCAEKLGISNDSIIAVGDGINDISMLDGSVTPLVGCPSNASSEVIEAVTKAGGVVAASESAAGTVEVLKYYLGSTQNSHQ